MKVINTKKSKDTELFYDSENKYCGFCGETQIYDEKIYIDTRNGCGYDLMVEKFGKFINYMSSKYNIPGQSFEDARQNMVIYILEGISEYNPSKGTKLSTFLQMRINRRLINEIRNIGLDSKNPTILQTTLYTVSCECGNKFTISLGKDTDIRSGICSSCQRSLKEAKIYTINKEPDSLYEMSVAGEKYYSIDDLMSDESSDIVFVAGKKKRFDRQIQDAHDLEKLLDFKDEKFNELLKLICFEDHSISSASKEVGLSNSSISNKIKKLRKNKILLDILRGK